LDPTNDNFNDDFDIILKCSKELKQVICISDKKIIYTNPKMFDKKDIKYIYNNTDKKIKSFYKSKLEQYHYHLIHDELYSSWINVFLYRRLYSYVFSKKIIKILMDNEFKSTYKDTFYCKDEHRNIKVLLLRYLKKIDKNKLYEKYVIHQKLSWYCSLESDF